MQDCKPVWTPLDMNVKLLKDGSLFCAAIATRPDIAQAVGTLAKLNSFPKEAHLTAVKHVFHYLKGAVKLRLSGLQIQRIEHLLLG